MSSQEIWSIIGSIGSVLGGVGSIFVAAGLYFLIRQTRANERATTASVYQSVVTLSSSLNNMFISEPELFKELFGPKADFSGNTVNSEQAMNPKRFFSALQWLDYFETVFVVFDSIPHHLHKPWRAFIRDYINESRYIRRIVLETDWYGNDLVQVCKEAELTLQNSRHHNPSANKPQTPSIPQYTKAGNSSRKARRRGN